MHVHCAQCTVKALANNTVFWLAVQLHLWAAFHANIDVIIIWKHKSNISTSFKRQRLYKGCKSIKSFPNFNCVWYCYALDWSENRNLITNTVKHRDWVQKRAKQECCTFSPSPSLKSCTLLNPFKVDSSHPGPEGAALNYRAAVITEPGCREKERKT